jgi:two-component system, OmpR family, KDP operon response regulator KdpE
VSSVLVVDDEPQLTAALASALGREGYDVVVAHDGVQAVELAATSAPDLVVLDLGLPGLPGLEVISRVRPWLAAPILVLSAASQTRQKAEALDAGADDYLQKPFGLDELLARLRALGRRRGSEGTSQVLHFEGLEIDLAASRVLAGGREVRLTPTEWRLLRQLATHPERLMTHGWLLEQVWDHSYGDETREALRTHVRTLRAKIGDDARSPRYIRTDSGSGYRWIAPAVDPDAPAAEPADTDTTPSAAPDPSLQDHAHELANAVTALRMAVQLLVRAPEPVSEATRAAYERLDEMSRRVADLVTTPAEDEPDEPDEPALEDADA